MVREKERRDKSFEPVKSFNLFKDSELVNKNPKKGQTRDTRRSFTDTQKHEILFQQDNHCAGTECKHAKLDPRAIRYHHIKPWAAGGRTITQNGAALCPICHEIIEHKNRLKKAEQRGAKKPKTKKSDRKSSNINSSPKPGWQFGV